MSSGLKLTSSTAHLYVDSKYTQMQSGIKLTSSTAHLYAENRTTKAAIIARINSDGESEALIAANRVSITGTTTLYGSFTMENGYLIVKKSAEFNGSVKILDDYLWANKIGLMGNEPSITFSAVVGLSITSDKLATTIMKAEKNTDGTELTLTQYDGNTVTFKKATTPTLSGSWSSGVLTVTSDPAPTERYRIILAHDASKDTWDANNKGVTLWVDTQKYNGSGAAPTPLDYDVKSFWVDTTTSYNAGRNSYSYSATLYCSSVTQDQSGKHVTLTVQYGLSQNNPFTQGRNYTVRW